LQTAGPLLSVKAFNDWFAGLYRRKSKNYILDPYRSSLPDDIFIKFTHGDLHRSNIILGKDVCGELHITAIIDWEQAGWLPEYWEVRKAIYSSPLGDEWADTYIPMFLEEWKDTWEAWDFYVAATGN
jgi:aminoglycoside phosphotransferase (APT) family kinase protein